MIVISPSNAHVERILYAMQTIKSEKRSTMSQHTLNNIYRVSNNSEGMANFSAQPFIDHRVQLSTKAGPNRLLVEGEKIPSVFRLKSNYPENSKASTSAGAEMHIKQEPGESILPLVTETTPIQPSPTTYISSAGLMDVSSHLSVHTDHPVEVSSGEEHLMLVQQSSVKLGFFTMNS